MRKQKLLREELERMRQLMGMNGSLYQKPLFNESKGKTPPSKGKDPQKGKPAAKPPAPKPKSPSPSPKPAPQYDIPKAIAPKTGTGAASALKDGEFVLPAGVIPGFGSKGGTSKGRGKGRSTRKTRGRKTRGRKTTRTRGKAKTTRAKNTKRTTRRDRKKKED